MGKEQPPQGSAENATDGELVRLAAAGDERAFELLIRRKRERVYWIAYRIVGNEEDARDVAQSTFVRLWRVLGKYRPDQNFDTWLHRITVNLAIDQYRVRGPSRATVPLPEADEPGFEPAARPMGDPLETMQGRELARVFQRLATRLGAKQRAIFVMSQIEGTPTEEIARLMGISSSTVRNHLFQARRSLQEGLRALYPEYSRRKDRGEE